MVFLLPRNKRLSKSRKLGFVNIIVPHGSDATPVIYNPVWLFRRVTAELICCVWSRRLFTRSDSSSSNAGPCVLSSCVFIDSTICSCVCWFNIILWADVCVRERVCEPKSNSEALKVFNVMLQRGFNWIISILVARKSPVAHTLSMTLRAWEKFSH